MDKILIIGAGKVGTALATALSGLEGMKVSVYNRSADKTAHLKDKGIEVIENLGPGFDPELVILAIADDAIQSVASIVRKHYPEALLVHTAGSQSLDLLGEGPTGLFYPLDSFGYDGDHNLSETPLFVEANVEADLKRLEVLAKRISQVVIRSSYDDRRYLHLAAVWVNNFTNALMVKAMDILEKEDIPREALFKLIQSTALKAITKGPENSQTGPAIRGDISTLKAHLKLMQKEDQDLYSLLSRLINPEIENEL